MNKSIILLSGGLDCATILSIAKEKENIELAIFFDYAQKAYQNEYNAVKNLCDYYKLKLEIIDLKWLASITNTSLVSENSIPQNIDINNIESSVNSMKKVWVPNRNGLFLNIAACYADSYDYDKIFIGANNEEAKTFSDNSENFIDATNKELEFSTLVKPKVVAPLINSNKEEIIKKAISNKLPFEFLWSCYESGEKHCGYCESCLRLKRGLEKEGLFDIVNLLF